MSENDGGEIFRVGTNVSTFLNGRSEDKRGNFNWTLCKRILAIGGGDVFGFWFRRTSCRRILDILRDVFGF